MRQTSKVSLFLFILNYNYVFLRLILFPYMYKEYSYMSYLYIGIIMIILSILFLVIPKVLYKSNIDTKYNMSKFKNVYNIVLLAKTILTLYIGAFLIQRIDYDMASIYYFIVGFIITVILISRNKSKDIIELSTWFVIAAIIIYMLAFFHMVNIDFSSLKIFNLEPPKIQLYLILISIFSDNLLFLIIDKSSIKVNKKTIILPILTQFIFVMFELYQMLLSAGDKLFLDYEYIGFVSLSFQRTSNYVGNLDFVYLFIVTMAVAINSAFNLSIIRYSYKFNKKLIVDLLLFITCLGSIILINQFSFADIVKYLLYISTLGVILLIWLLKEAYNARKIKE